MNKQVTTNWTNGGSGGPTPSAVVTLGLETDSDQDVLSDHMIVVSSSVSDSVDTVTSSWAGLSEACKSTRGSGETKPEFLIRHGRLIKAKALNNPITPT